MLSGEFEVIEADNEKELKYKMFKPNIVMDIVMPEMDGVSSYKGDFKDKSKCENISHHSLCTVKMSRNDRGRSCGDNL